MGSIDFFLREIFFPKILGQACMNMTQDYENLDEGASDSDSIIGKVEGKILGLMQCYQNNC